MPPVGGVAIASDKYSEKYGGSTSSAKPECYGDIDVYDDADDVCEDCEFRKSCKVIVDKKLKREVKAARSSSRGRGSKRRRRRRSEEDEEEFRLVPTVDPDRREVDGMHDSWWGVLVYNAFLSSTKAVLLEAHHGLDSIPHAKYPNPFSRNRKD